MHFKPWGLIILLSFIGISLISCDASRSKKGDSTVLAKVFDHDLEIQDIPDDLKNNENSEDRNALMNAYVDQWVRKMLLLHEAEKRKPESLDIEKLVEDYKQSLLISNLEKQVIDQELDTMVTAEELNQVYDQIKENFVQDFPIIRLNYIKISEKAPRIDKFYEWWKNDAYSSMDDYVEKYAVSAILGKDEWWEWNDIQNQIDTQILQLYSFKKPRSIQKNIGEFEYFISVFEFVDKGETSPLSYIEEQVRNIIIQRRKVTVMDEYLERLYQNEIKKKNIILHTS
jgi:hypothetical protein